MRQVLERLTIEPDGKRALAVGSGRGLLARELARLGFRVTALDPAAAAVRLAARVFVGSKAALSTQVRSHDRLAWQLEAVARVSEVSRATH